jgi:hypothetical protein
MAPGQRASRRGPRGPTGLLGLERNGLEEDDPRGEAEAMAGATAGRCSGNGLWPGEDLAKAGLSTDGRLVSSWCTRVHAHAQRHRSGNRWRACACAASRRTGAERLGGAAGVASACDGPRVQARERACELRNNPALAPSG